MKNIMFLASIIFFNLIIVNSYAIELSDFKSVRTTSENDMFMAMFEFSQPVDAEQIVVEYINQTIQLYIPGTRISKGKDFSRIQDDKIKTIYSYPLGKRGIRSRIIYKSPILAETFKDSISLKSEGNKLILSINYNNGTVGSLKKVGVKSLPKVMPADIDSSLVERNLSPVLFEVNEETLSAEDIVEKELGKDFEAAAAKNKLKSATGAAVNTKNAKLVEQTTAGKEKLNNSSEVSMAKSSDLVTQRNKLKKISQETTSKEKMGISLKDKDKKESEIPVFTAKNKTKEATASPYSRMILSFLVVVVLGVGMTLFAKWWGKNHKKSLGDNHIRMITQHHIGPKKSIAIIRVAGESILIGVTDHNISMLKTLALIDGEVPVESETENNFENTLNAMAENESMDSKNIEVKDRTNLSSSKIADDFSYGQIKDMVSTKLKKMRSI